MDNNILSFVYVVFPCDFFLVFVIQVNVFILYNNLLLDGDFYNYFT